jgi:hypothetical protein
MGARRGSSLVSQAQIEEEFPGLGRDGYQITSPEDPTYNCIAWAAEEADAWWWPDPLGTGYWPIGAPRAETLSAFEAAYRLIGYSRCDDGSLEPGFEKVAVFAGTDQGPTHAARQLPTGAWTSKLGSLEDVTHLTLLALGGESYGSPVLFLKRPS